MEGRTFSAILQERRRFSLKECAGFFSHICSAIHSAHNAQVLHRDLKPSNIMLDTNGYIKTLDFGLARMAKDALSQTSSLDASGTLAYMAPEQHPGHSWRASDIYSLGVCLHEMLTGELPFKGPDFLAQKERMLYTAPNFIAAYLPKEIEPFMASALEYNHKKRIRDAAAFLSKLIEISSRTGTTNQRP